MSSAIKEYQHRKTEEAAENVFGPPFAYVKANKTSFSPVFFLVGVSFVVMTALDFLLLTNIVIYIRTLDVEDTTEVFKHSAVIAVSLFAIWVSYKIMVWMIKTFNIKKSIQNNKLYQKINHEVIELENLLSGEQAENKRD